MCKTTTGTATQQLPITLPGANVPGITNVPGANDQDTTANVTYPKPTTLGRALEIGTLGKFDPTGGVDTGKFEGAKPTKFGALLNVLKPVVEGAAIGGFEGRATPEGGFGAAQNFFIQQMLRRMQIGQYYANLAKMQSDIYHNTAEANYANRRGAISRPGPAIKGVDASGKPIYYTQDIQTGEYEPQEGITPPPPEPDMQVVPTNQGMVEVDRHGTGAPIPLTLGSTPKSTDQQETEGSPAQSPGGTRSGAPLMPPGFGQKKAAIVTNRDASGRETSSLIDEDPNSPTFGQVLKGNVASRAPKPNSEANNRAAAKQDTADAETIAGSLLGKVGNDPDKAIQALNQIKISDPKSARRMEELMPLIRKAIRDRAKPGRTGKPTITPQQAQAMGLLPTEQAGVTQ